MEDIEYFPDTMKALKSFQEQGFDLFVVTNQSGIGRGYFSFESVHTIHRQLQTDLKDHKLEPFKDFAVCPHSPDDSCDCRKPSGKMIQELIDKYHIAKDRSFMIGDKLIDAEAGKNAGITGALVRSANSSAFPTYKNLLEIAETLKTTGSLQKE